MNVLNFIGNTIGSVCGMIYGGLGKRKRDDEEEDENLTEAARVLKRRRMEESG